jgi:crotonobetaine/carnitine-CoA ligase
MSERASDTRIVADVLRARAASDPDAPAVRCGGGWLTNAELDAVSDRVAGGLRGLGVAKGDRVAFILPNRTEHIELLFACAKLGAVQVPVNTYLKGEFLRYQLADAAAEVVVVDTAGARALRPLLDDLPVRTVVNCEEPGPGEIPYAELRDAEPAEPADLDVADLVSILYTSGTTGPSKGCMLSNGYYTASPPVFREHGWVADGDRVFSAFQLFHGAAHTMLMQAMCTPGGSVCFEPSFSASTFVARAAEERATLIWALAPMAMAVLARDPAHDPDADSGFRLAVIPGLPVEQAQAFERRFGVPVAGEIYGQTECLGIAFSSVHGQRRPGTLGRPAPHLDVALVDGQDRPVAPGEIGEIVVRPRTPYAMYSGYWRKPEATMTAWRNLWHHTGDAATADADGYLSFVDRTRDSLRRRGENVSSFELEFAVMRHPAVLRAAAVAVPSPLGEDDIKVCIVAAPGDPPTPEQLFGFFAENLPYYAVPRYLELRDALPTTAATDRVQKHVLRAEGVTDRTWDLEAMGLTVSRSSRR